MKKEKTDQSSWIDKVKSLSQADEVEAVVKAMLAGNVNAVNEMVKAQAAARAYLDNDKKIPESLHNAIQFLGKQNSGYTGLTVWEAYIYEIKANT